MLTIKKEWCKSCGMCIMNCPKQAISKAGEFNASGFEVIDVDRDKCIECGICYTVCPDWVFEIRKEESEQ